MAFGGHAMPHVKSPGRPRRSPLGLVATARLQRPPGRLVKGRRIWVDVHSAGEGPRNGVAGDVASNAEHPDDQITDIWNAATTSRRSFCATSPAHETRS